MIYKNKTFDEERALYGISGCEVTDCVFDGPADGESAFKECRRIKVINCDFRLRYPFWHVDGAEIKDCRMTETCRAALWYDSGVKIKNSRLHGIKALRECVEILLDGCDVNSAEFGWRCRDIEIKDTVLISEYPFFECRNMIVDNLDMTGKYSFQYAENVTIKNSDFKTKDAFWHAKNVTVYDSVIKGEYLGWYSEGLKLVNCKIIGTQPLCYCKDLVLENCEMEGTDLSFENSDVMAEIRGEIVSVKNPASGYINADLIGEVILDGAGKYGSSCVVRSRGESVD